VLCIGYKGIPYPPHWSISSSTLKNRRLYIRGFAVSPLLRSVHPWFFLFLGSAAPPFLSLRSCFFSPVGRVVSQFLRNWCHWFFIYQVGRSEPVSLTPESPTIGGFRCLFYQPCISIHCLIFAFLKARPESTRQGLSMSFKSSALPWT
jgi:hypothetical protein